MRFFHFGVVVTSITAAWAQQSPPPKAPPLPDEVKQIEDRSKQPTTGAVKLPDWFIPTVVSGGLMYVTGWWARGQDRGGPGSGLGLDRPPPTPPSEGGGGPGNGGDTIKTPQTGTGKGVDRAYYRQQRIRAQSQQPPKIAGPIVAPGLGVAGTLEVYETARLAAIHNQQAFSWWRVWVDHCTSYLMEDPDKTFIESRDWCRAEYRRLLLAKQDELPPLMTDPPPLVDPERAERIRAEEAQDRYQQQQQQAQVNPAIDQTRGTAPGEEEQNNGLSFFSKVADSFGNTMFGPRQGAGEGGAVNKDAGSGSGRVYRPGRMPIRKGF